jgi:hypothetical protein
MKCRAYWRVYLRRIHLVNCPLMYEPTSVYKLLATLHQSLNGKSRPSFIPIAVTLEAERLTFQASASYGNQEIRLQVVAAELVSQLALVLAEALEEEGELDVEQLLQVLHDAFPTQYHFEEECLALSRYANVYAEGVAAEKPVPIYYVVSPQNSSVFLVAGDDNDSYYLSPGTCAQLHDTVGGKQLPYEEYTFPDILRWRKLRQLAS